MVFIAACVHVQCKTNEKEVSSEIRSIETGFILELSAVHEECDISKYMGKVKCDRIYSLCSSIIGITINNAMHNWI